MCVSLFVWIFPYRMAIGCWIQLVIFTQSGALLLLSTRLEKTGANTPATSTHSSRRIYAPSSCVSRHPASSCIRFRRGHISFLIPPSKDRLRRQVAPFFLIFLQIRVAQRFARSAPAHKNLVISFHSHRAYISLYSRRIYAI